ncbi:MAG: hypothetical protein ACE10D_11370 [Planctomycetota bacterium]|nr:hypothetical protein [Planctomycetota bacterium]
MSACSTAWGARRATGRWRDYSIAVRAAFVSGMLAALALVAAYMGVGLPQG